MSAPGTAYDDPILGKDPQPADMDHYVELKEDEDDGGVHINSGIPNRAFYLAATAIGGPAWERHQATAYDCPRISREWLEEQRTVLGERWWSQDRIRRA